MTSQSNMEEALGVVTATTVISPDYEYVSGSYETDEVQYITGFAPSTSPGADEEEEATGGISTLAVGILLSLMIVLIAFGNSLVVLSVFLERRLRTFENFFFASLAVADLSIAVFVLPFCLTVELSGYWQYSFSLCDLFIFADVACCTASILHLCAIGLNRYWSITSPLKYATKQTCRRAFCMITSVWVLSILIACPPLLGWPKRQRNEHEVEYQCAYDVDIAYVIYSSCGSFFIPLLVMTVVYIQIFRLSIKGARFRRLSSYQSKSKQPGSAPASPKERNAEERSLQRQLSGKRLSPQRKESFHPDDSHRRKKKRSKIVALICPVKVQKTKGVDKPKRRQAETKTAKTLGIIMGAFVICWLPFFLIYLINPLCKACHIPVLVERFALWLGYFNSLLNPLIYICCKPLFRVTFKRILTFYYCRKSVESRHRRHEMHYFRGQLRQALASWDCPDNSLTRRQRQHHPESFGDAFSEGCPEKRQAGLRQMPLGQYADEFGEKCARCQQDVDPLDSSGANQDIEDYLNYVIANGYLRPDLCKNLGIGDMFQTHKCDSKFHCGHCCKANHGNEQLTSNSVKSDKGKLCGSRASRSPGVDLVCSALSSQGNKSDRQETVHTAKLESCLHESKEKIEPEMQSSPSTACALTQVTTLPSPDHTHKPQQQTVHEVTHAKSAASFGLTRDSCSCSFVSSKGGSDIVRIAHNPSYNETGL